MITLVRAVTIVTVVSLLPYLVTAVTMVTVVTLLPYSFTAVTTVTVVAFAAIVTLVIEVPWMSWLRARSRSVSLYLNSLSCSSIC